MVEEYAKRATEINQQFLCISDHGAMGAIPRQITACEKNKISPLFACELYINRFQPEVPLDTTTAEFLKKIDLTEEERNDMRVSSHLLAIAYTNEGYSNLCKLSSWAWSHGVYYGKPRINYEILEKHKEGIIFSSCCYLSETGRAFEKGGAAFADEVIKRYIQMFGKENFRLEMMFLDWEKQKPYNIYIQDAAHRFGLDCLLTQDCHFCKKDHAKFSRYMLMIQTGSTVAQHEASLASGNSDSMLDQDPNLYMKSEEELNQKWLDDYSQDIELDFFQQAKRNTVKVCERAKGVVLDRSIKLPSLPNDEAKLKEEIIKGYKWRQLPNTAVYIARIKEEYELICRKGFCSYFLIEQMMAAEARRYYKSINPDSDGSEPVGPGRGSGVGSLILYCLGVTDVDPIKHDLLFARFMSPARGGKQMKIRFSRNPMVPEVQ